MKILGSLGIAACAAFGAFGAIFTSKPAHSAVAMPVAGTFIVVFLICLALCAQFRRADRRRAADHGRRLAQIRADGDRAIEAGREQRRRASAREQRVRRVELALIQVQHSRGGYSWDPDPAPVQRRLEAVLAGAKRNASRAETAEAERRQMHRHRSWF